MKNKPAPKGNNYWQFRKKHGIDFKYTAETLWDEFIEYCEWIEANPLKEQKVFMYQGEAIKTNVTKMRAMTERSFCLFADISHGTWENYRKDEKRPDMLTTTERIRAGIYSQKLEGAAADLLNANLIAREMGMHDTIKNVTDKPAVHIHTRASKDVNQLMNDLKAEE